jgi:hypothetical protein
MRNLAVGVAILSILPLLAEGAEVMHVKWENLSMVQGQTVRVFLPGGFVTGKAASVEADTLVVDVRKTSDSKTYPRGVLRVPRDKVHRFEMQTKGKTGRIVLTALGTVVGLAGGFATAAFGVQGCDIFTCRHDRRAAAGAAFVGIAVAGVAGGYFAGNALDKRWTAIEIVP